MIFRKKPSAIISALLPRQTEMTIVCGDGAGDEIDPRKTILTSDGTCAGCGGRSFVCAVRLFKVLKRHLLAIQN